MAKAIGMLLMVVAIWAGLEIYTNGLDGAFGGWLGGGEATEEAARSAAEHFDGTAADAPERRTVVQRAGDSVQQSFDQGMRRYDGLADQ